ncbi:MAG TPA: hypothetical protein VN420_01130 [Candidatus Fimivivens sp.]|nr:hypothetical protein [Candidatus Fimivivens sp.]
MKDFLKNWYPAGIFLLVAVAVMAPACGSGFVFLTDMVWGPNNGFADLFRNEIGSGTALNALRILLSFAIPADILQKIVLTVVLFLPGIGMYRLASRYMNRALAVGAGLLFMLNPFVYERLLIGQWVVLLGYGFLPFAVLLFDRFLERRDWKRFLWFSFAFSVYPLLGIHYAYIAAGFLLTFGLVHLARTGEWKSLWTPISFARILSFVVLFLLVNGFWLFPFLGSSGELSKFGLADFDAFSALPDPHFGIWFNILSLYGIWSNNFLSPKDFHPYWFLVTPVVLVFSAVGAYRLMRQGTVLAWTIALSFVPVVLIAVGYADDLTKPLIEFLYRFVPFFSGLRDTEKAVGVLAFSYALLVPVGVAFLFESIGKRFLGGARSHRVAVAVVAVLPFLWAGTALWGAHGQIAAHPYPHGWYGAEHTLRADPDTKSVLILPWHQYIRLDFADGVMVANPGGTFFSEPAVVGKDTGNRLLFLSETDPFDEHVARLTEAPMQDEGSFWKSRGISHIVIAKTDDWEKFSGLYSSDSFDLIYDSDSISVFKIK